MSTFDFIAMWLGYALFLVGSLAILVSLAGYTMHKIWSVYRDAKGWADIHEAMELLRNKRAQQAAEAAKEQRDGMRN
jgi:uncharacterized membrane protein